ncbi:MAG: hypothetical protein JRJ00_17675 [Deltaproteobacteria bacterium]|nr:hypothetical protein [Deltaproteobacteria bacterium]
MRETVFFKQAELLLRVLPLIQAESVFALIWGIFSRFCILVKIKIPERIPEDAAPNQ